MYEIYVRIYFVLSESRWDCVHGYEYVYRPVSLMIKIFVVQKSPE
jgi:hypothetical protein